MRRSCALVGAVLIVIASSAPASESCSLMSGTCRDRCEANEQAENGAFDDCGERQECCVTRRLPDPVRCCISSLAAQDFGPANCAAPAGTACPSGSASPVSCMQLPMCR